MQRTGLWRWVGAAVVAMAVGNAACAGSKGAIQDEPVGGVPDSGRDSAPVGNSDHAPPAVDDTGDVTDEAPAGE